MTQPDFKSVYDQHKALVWRLAANYAAGRHDREDLFQEIFLKVHQALPRFEGRSSLTTWIYKIAANTALNYVKKHKRYAQLKALFGAFRPVEADARTVDEGVLFKPLQKLNPQQRLILIMSDVEDRSLAEISEVLNLPLGTVKSNLHRAREIVKKELNGEDGLQ